MRLSALVFAAVFTVIAAPQEGTVFRSGVSLVRLDIEAADARGEILTGLQAEDFRVLDGGVPQSPVHFSFEKDPVDLILLFETSRDMTPKLHQILRAVELGFHELQAGDRVCVMTFAGNAVEVAPFSANMEAVNQTILLNVLAVKFAGPSKPDLAAADAALRFRREPVTERRRAVLMIGQKAGAKPQAAVRELWQSNAVFSQLIPEKPGANHILPPGENAMADETGGSTVLAGDPGPAFQDALRRLRRRYSLYYSMPPGVAGTARQVSVAFSPDAAQRFPGARIHARTGYVLPEAH